MTDWVRAFLVDEPSFISFLLPLVERKEDRRREPPPLLLDEKSFMEPPFRLLELRDRFKELLKRRCC